MVTMNTLNDLNINIYADGAEIEKLEEIKKLDFIKGFTTNPTLMKQAGIKNYKDFALKFTQIVGNYPVSFEVFSDDIAEMQKQAEEIASWNKNIIIKVPITNTKGESTKYLIKNLTDQEIPLNITAIFTINQINEVIDFINPKTYCILSIFAGRIADTGVDPVPLFKEIKKIVDIHSNIDLLWASPRELLNIFHANQSGADIITVHADILNKLKLINKDLNEYSIETVKMFYNDAQKAGFNI